MRKKARRRKRMEKKKRRVGRKIYVEGGVAGREINRRASNASGRCKHTRADAVLARGRRGESRDG